jgi:hypothetical protein
MPITSVLVFEHTTARFSACSDQVKRGDRDHRSLVANHRAPSANRARAGSGEGGGFPTTTHRQEPG